MEHKRSLLTGLFTKQKTKEKVPSAPVTNHLTLVSPLTGTIVPLSDVPDPVFADGILGEGIAVMPSQGQVYAPADGKIEHLPDSSHAISMTTDAGPELLIHVGIDTVSLAGKHYHPHVKTGDHVKAGALLLTFDIEKIREAGYSSVTPILLTGGYESLRLPECTEIRAGDPIFSCSLPKTTAGTGNP